MHFSVGNASVKYTFKALFQFLFVPKNGNNPVLFSKINPFFYLKVNLTETLHEKWVK